ncbi:alpha/beta fold hydrolase [Nioella sp.]|uniref:alpha/beta fold hydrolase n=1 Tax=Nioella sp. TaxID=1912091 RepID=UPI003B52983B
MLHCITKGSGRNLLVLHGATLDHRHMVETVEPLFKAREGWRRIYVDLPGHGQSPTEGVVTQEDLLSRVAAFMVATFPDEPFAIIGESRGSYIAQGLAYLRPDLVEGGVPDRAGRRALFGCRPDTRTPGHGCRPGSTRVAERGGAPAL